jgi:hypothetical protein
MKDVPHLGNPTTAKFRSHATSPVTFCLVTRVSIEGRGTGSDAMYSIACLECLRVARQVSSVFIRDSDAVNRVPIIGIGW